MFNIDEKALEIAEQFEGNYRHANRGDRLTVEQIIRKYEAAKASATEQSINYAGAGELPYG